MTDICCCGHVRDEHDEGRCEITGCECICFEEQPEDLEPMKWAGGYTLDLYCDLYKGRWEEPHRDQYGARFHGRGFDDCAKQARRKGWIIRVREGTARCPKCSGRKVKEK